MVDSNFCSLFRIKAKSLSKYESLKKYVEKYSNMNHIKSFDTAWLSFQNIKKNPNSNNHGLYKEQRLGFIAIQFLVFGSSILLIG